MSWAQDRPGGMCSQCSPGQDCKISDQNSARALPGARSSRISHLAAISIIRSDVTRMVYLLSLLRMCVYPQAQSSGSPASPEPGVSGHEDQEAGGEEGQAGPGEHGVYTRVWH